MAKMTGGSVTLELSADELETVREGLRAYLRYEYDRDDKARDLLADLEA